MNEALHSLPGPKPHASPRDPARALERDDLDRLHALPVGIQVRADPAAVGRASGVAVHVGAHADLVHHAAGLGTHARQQLDARAPDGRGELEADARRSKLSRVPDRLFVVRERIRRWRLQWPPPRAVGGRLCGDDFRFFRGGAPRLVRSALPEEGHGCGEGGAVYLGIWWIYSSAG